MKFFKKALLFFGSIILLLSVEACMDEASFYTHWFVEPDEPANAAKPIVSEETFTYTNSGEIGNYPGGSPVAVLGKLKVVGTRLCDEKGNPVQLRGLFLRGTDNEGKFINRNAIEWLSKKCKMDVLRVPLWTESYIWGNISETGYLRNRAIEHYIRDAVRYTEECGIYCIIDWHIMRDGDPGLYIKEAKDFFKRMAFLYGAKKHVLYEICNEPNHAGWASKIKPYAEIIIPAIRAGDSNSVILVGTERWSGDLHHAARDPLKFNNVMYTVHFYPGSHPLWITNSVAAALTNIAVFCTEWGMTSADPTGPLYWDQSQAWVKFLNEKNISWCNYSLSDIRENTSFFRQSTRADGGWEDSSLSWSGKFIRDQMTNR